jgi:hypothetical protein
MRCNFEKLWSYLNKQLDENMWQEVLAHRRVRDCSEIEALSMSMLFLTVMSSHRHLILTL